MNSNYFFFHLKKSLKTNATKLFFFLPFPGQGSSRQNVWNFTRDKHSRVGGWGECNKGVKNVAISGGGGQEAALDKASQRSLSLSNFGEKNSRVKIRYQQDLHLGKEKPVARNTAVSWPAAAWTRPNSDVAF